MYEQLNIPAAWSRNQLVTCKDFIYTLSPAQLSEIDAALNYCKELSVERINKADFPLPTLSKTITDQFSDQLENGIGALLLKGLNIQNYNKSELEKIFWGLGLYFGTSVSQSVDGEKLHRVEDQGYKVGDKKARGTNSNIKLWFHNDVCDVAGLMCIRKASAGGESQIVSSASIHNKILQTNPELLEQLYQPYYFRRHNINTTLEHGFFSRPIFSSTQGQFACNILRPLIDRAQQLQAVPTMSEQQIKALDLFEKFAASEELCHTFFLDPGDILFLNSYVTLHSRQAFVDYENSSNKRLLLRLWLSAANSRPLPESYRIAYGEVTAGAIRGGIKPITQEI